MQAVDLSPRRGLLLLDIDDVLCLSQPFGGYHARGALWHPAEAPKDLWEKLFHPPAVVAMQELMSACRPQVVLTSSWLAIMDRQHFVEVFRRTGLGAVAEALHPNWAAPQNRGVSRHDAISKWLEVNHRGEPILILDDQLSGESLVESEWDAAGHQILCEVDVGFHPGLLTKAMLALRKPYVKPAWW
ncbi:HAD domain-containing protein [Roseateles cavernae]|uniref:HAD domain-containing protein n=1 Tax=Roseateles cavernae TaxID=3153578 RepID=UPI0032E3D2B4